MNSRVKEAKNLLNDLLVIDDEVLELNLKAENLFKTSVEKAETIKKIAEEESQTVDELEEDIKKYMEDNNESFVINGVSYGYDELFNADDEDNFSEGNCGENIKIN